MPYRDWTHGVNGSAQVTLLDMSDEDKERARIREERIAREGFGFARALYDDEGDDESRME